MRMPSWVVGSAVACAVVTTGACAATMAPTRPVMTPAGVQFELLSLDAQGVALAGSFNQWSAVSHPLARDARGLWRVVVPLPPGEHLFMYVVDGAWVDPPLAEDFADDGFGARNGIVVVRP